MTILESLEILKEYNKWRLGAETEMIEPKIITEAINIAIEYIDKYENNEILA